jgi:Pyruvate/2-oxoacid:ferredoxin oxidoreductase gamma subunit
MIALEALEGLRESSKVGSQTKILINEYFLPFLNSLAKEEIIKKLKESQKDFYLVPASEICKNKLQNEVVCTIYLLGYAVNRKLIPLKGESVIKAIKNVIPEKYLELNVKAFKLGHG